jgi:DNA-directed RNA polymerase specialized sigma24 family protein
LSKLSVATLRSLRAIAARHSRVQHELDDVVQDVLLAAMAQGKDIGDPHFTAWAAGAIRLRSRFLARTAARRKRREGAYASTPRSTNAATLRLPDTFIEGLPPSRRIVALLVNLGMGRKEIAYLLGLTDIALRQRLAGLKKAMAAAGVCPQSVQEPDSDRPSGLARRSLKVALPPRPVRQFAVRDPDGMTILIAGPTSGGHISDGGGN